MAKPQYGYAHKKARALAIASMVEGTPCPRCHRPMYKRQRLQLGHVISVAMGGTNGPTRLEHGACNESAGAKLGNRIKVLRTNRNARINGRSIPSISGDSPYPKRKKLPVW